MELTRLARKADVAAQHELVAVALEEVQRGHVGAEDRGDPLRRLVEEERQRWDAEYASETVDAAWAVGAEQEVRRVLALERPFGQASIESLQCRATKCRLVVVNERTGSVVISGEVEIGSVVVTHKNLVIEAGAIQPAERFVGLESGATRATSLKSLVEALNAVKLPTADIIDIIKGLEKNGKLQGKLVIE